MIKLLLFIIVSVIINSIYAQVPQGFSYQAIALNSSGSPVVNSTVSVRISILDNSPIGTTLYTETHSKSTNANGLYNLTIGQGMPTYGTFSSINWFVNLKYLSVEIDPLGGSSYLLVGSSQLLSVPYAFHSNTSNSLTKSSGSNPNTFIYLSNGF